MIVSPSVIVTTLITNLTYDSAGNLTNEGTGGHTYTYNGQNQITRIDGSGSDNYIYDGEGRRAKKTIGGVSTFYFYGPGGIISEFSTTSGSTGASTSDKTNYQTSDRQGTAVLLIAASGLVVENNRTLPYGELWSPQISTATTKKYTTYERDSESNLDYAMNRYLANNYGRFQSSDKGPILLAEPSTMNRYLYASADPINRLDAGGNQSQLVGLTGGIPTVLPPTDDVLDLITALNACGYLEDGRRALDCRGEDGVPEGGETEQQLAAESCSFSMHLMLECGDETGAVAGATPLIQRGLGGAVIGGTILARLMGSAGEAHVSRILNGLAKNTTAITNTLSGLKRIPDFISGRTLVEVKNVASLSFTQQIRDMAYWAKDNGYTFVIYLRAGAERSGPLKQAIADGLIRIEETVFPLIPSINIFH